MDMTEWLFSPIFLTKLLNNVSATARLHVAFRIMSELRRRMVVIVLVGQWIIGDVSLLITHDLPADP